VTSLAANWFAHLLQAFWQDTAVALVVLALLLVMRRASPQLRHALVLLALLKFAIPPMLPLPTGIFSAAPPAPAIEPIGRLVGAATAADVAPLLVALMFLHAGGAAWALVRLALETFRLRGIRKRATARAGVLVSAEITVPMTAGVFRPFILLPESLVDVLSPAELADVLAHEREHVRRRDVLFNWLQELILAVWWFHPLAARLGREARALREEPAGRVLRRRAAGARGLRKRALCPHASPRGLIRFRAASRGCSDRRVRTGASSAGAPDRRRGLLARPPPEHVRRRVRGPARPAAAPGSARLVREPIRV
jgi:beta-lactamase regulating signal transducer with metallopeptidase domain